MNTYSDFCKTYLPVIDAALEDSISFAFQDSRAEIEEAMRYVLLGKGKRFRPLLCFLTFSLFKHDLSPIVPYAIATEMLHTFSLIHDDLPSIDNDDFRRGVPTCHKQFDEAIAVLTGDSLNTLAFDHISHTLPSIFGYEKTVAAIQQLSRAIGIRGMIGGEVIDIRSHTFPPSISSLKHLHKLKTGCLIQASIIGSAILADAHSSDISILTSIGLDLGLLFQISDDILDTTQSFEVLGKTPNKDILQKKLTYVSLLGLEGAIQEKNKLASDLQESLCKLSVDTSLFSDLIAFVGQRNR
jgi:geranylgeranyl pyrophosphate synthase